jgi:ArsR family transcriptional regulator, arsenate/arsenite/antimonite-responsive transcriptional repressor
MKEQKLKQTTRIIKAIADENRIRIICLLKFKKDLCVCEITELIGLAQPTISSHLKLLENAGLIEPYKAGLWVNYNIAGSPDKFTAEFMENLYNNLKSDEQIKKDEENTKKINRDIICKKKAC